jgi:hypothetical protein
MGLDVAKLVFYFEKWRKKSQKVTNFVCVCVCVCLFFLEKKHWYNSVVFIQFSHVTPKVMIGFSQIWLQDK